MSDPTAIEICEAWFASLDRQREDTVKLQRAASLARQGKQEEARRIQSAVDRQPRVFDGARLEPAVKELIAENKNLRSTVSVLQGRLKLAEIDREFQSKLLQFTQAMAEISFEGGTADGWDIQSKLDDCGLITEETMTEPCSSDYCPCAEVTDFPTECYRFTPEYLAAREAMQTAQQDGEEA